MIDEEGVKKQRQSVIDVGQRNQFEAMQAEIRKNNETLTSLRRENKELRVAMQQSLRGQSNVNIDDHYQKEEELLHNKMAVLKRSLNAVKGKNGELSKEIEKTIEENQIVQLEGGGAIDENSPIAQKIRALENRLDKCLIKHNEVNAIRRTYETLLERLQLEQSGFDTQLAATEKTLLNTEKELAELSEVGQSSSKERDAAKAQVTQLRAKLIEERRTQRKDIEQRRGFVQEKRDALERKHNALLLKMSQQEDRHMRVLNSTARDSSRRRNHNRSDSSSVALRPEELEQAMKCKEAYQKLRDATMTTNVSAVIESIIERKQSNKHLRHVAAGLEEDKKRLEEEKKALQVCWDEVNQRVGGAMVAAKFTRSARDKHRKINGDGAAGGSNEDGASDNCNVLSGSDGASLDPALAADYRLLGDRKRESRQILEEFEGHLKQRNAELEESEKKQETLIQLLLDVEAGVQHLAEKLSVQHNFGGGVVAVTVGDTTGAQAQSCVNLAGAAAAAGAGGGVNDAGEKDVSAVILASSSNMDLLRNCNAKLQLMLEELSMEDVDRAARAMHESKVLIPDTNIRIPAVAAAAAALASRHGSHSADGADDEDDDAAAAGRYGKYGAAGGGAGGHTVVDDFPDNEIHDRQELKMMALAAVEREEKKARKQLQRRKEETV